MAAMTEKQTVVVCMYMGGWYHTMLPPLVPQMWPCLHFACSSGHSDQARAVVKDKKALPYVHRAGEGGNNRWHRRGGNIGWTRREGRNMGGTRGWGVFRGAFRKVFLPYSALFYSR